MKPLVGEGGVLIDSGPLADEVADIVAGLRGSGRSAGGEALGPACRVEERYRLAVRRCIVPL